MRQLPLELTLEKNRLTSDHPWIVLLEVELPTGEQFYLTNDNQEHTFRGKTYHPTVPFTMTIAKSGSQGEIPTITLTLSDPAQVITPYVEAANGGIDGKVKVILVDAKQLDLDYSELEFTYDVVGCQMATSGNASTTTLEFTLGAPNPLRWRFPPNAFLAKFCSWRFKSVECGYQGSATHCDRTLDNCRALNNTSRFGGFPGIGRNYVRFA